MSLCFGCNLRSVSKKRVSFQNPTSTFALLCPVNNSNKNKTKLKTTKHQKIPTEKLLQGIKSFGLDRIIDIWTLLQPEEERKRRECPPCCVGWTQAHSGGVEAGGQVLSQFPFALEEPVWLLLISGGMPETSCFQTHRWLFPDPFLRSLSFSVTLAPRPSSPPSFCLPG